MKKIAITGNIASGKSQVENIIAKEFPVYDTDKIAHQILDNITEFYGLDVFTDGKIDRQKLGNLVFANADVKQKLEALIHPKIKLELEQIFEQHVNDKFVFVSVPLLFEVHWENLFDKIILVTADENIRLNRLMQRNNLSREDALLRIHSQMSEEEKINKADFIIKNLSTIENLSIQISKILSLI